MRGYQRYNGLNRNNSFTTKISFLENTADDSTRNGTPSGAGCRRLLTCLPSAPALGVLVRSESNFDSSRPI